MLKTEVSKSDLEQLVRELPDETDIEEVMYRIYLLQKINEGETAFEEGQTVSHEDAVNRLSKKWQNWSGQSQL